MSSNRNRSYSNQMQNRSFNNNNDVDSDLADIDNVPPEVNPEENNDADLERNIESPKNEFIVVENNDLDLEQNNTEDITPENNLSDDIPEFKDTQKDDVYEEIQDKGTSSMLSLSLNGLLDSYFKLITGVVSEKEIQLAIRKFSDIVKMVINNPTKETFDIVYLFFKKNEKMKNPAIVLNGIQYVPTAMRDKVELFFTVFKLITTDSKETLKSFDKESVRVVFESEEFYHYISDKYDNLKNS